METFPDDAVIQRMLALSQEWHGVGDSRAAFLDCYMRMTASMLRAIEQGEFHDPVWVDTLLRRFAGYYFAALAVYDLSAADAPAVWRVAHDAARNRGGVVLQHMLLGINAHINYDLVLTLVDMLDSEWLDLSDEQRHLRYVDHCHVNDVIARTVDAVQDEVVERYTPAFDLADRVLGPLDEWALSHWLARWREEVWQHAVDLLGSSDADKRQVLLKNVEAATLERADALLLDDITDLVRRWV